MGDEMDERSDETLCIMLSGRLGQMCKGKWSAILNERLGDSMGERMGLLWSKRSDERMGERLDEKLGERLGESS